MRISDWSSDVCSSDLPAGPLLVRAGGIRFLSDGPGHAPTDFRGRGAGFASRCAGVGGVAPTYGGRGRRSGLHPRRLSGGSEEHTSELPSLMRMLYAVVWLEKKNDRNQVTKS